MKGLCRLCLGAITFAAIILNMTLANAQSYPSKPVKLIVPFAAGGDIDSLARILGNHLQSVWGQAVLVESRAGAGGTIATEYVARSEPDGYTLLMCSSGPVTIAPSLNPKLSYSAEKDFFAVGLIGTGPMVLLVNKTVQAPTFPEFIKFIKSSPTQLTFASAGVGSLSHLTAMAFASSAGISLVHVPYRGGAPAVQDLIGGHVNMGFNPTPSSLTALANSDSGIRALAVTSAKRSVFFPDVPSLAELGLNNFDISSWYGICAPKALPIEIGERINRDLRDATISVAVKEQFRALGTEAIGSTIAEFSTLIKDDQLQWGKIIKDNNIQQQ